MSPTRVIHRKVIQAEITTYQMLSAKEAELVEKAREARENAQAPYSNYHVGAAVRSAFTGKVYTGCNVERVTWTQTTHAEQAAVDVMIAAEGPGAKIAAIAVVGGPAGRPVIFAKEIDEEERPFRDLPAPCGHCLQIIWENCLGDPGITILGVTAQGEICRMRIDDAFPVRFGPQWFEAKQEAA